MKGGGGGEVEEERKEGKNKKEKKENKNKPNLGLNHGLSAWETWLYFCMKNLNSSFLPLGMKLRNILKSLRQTLTGTKDHVYKVLSVHHVHKRLFLFIYTLVKIHPM